MKKYITDLKEDEFIWIQTEEELKLLVKELNRLDFKTDSGYPYIVPQLLELFKQSDKGICINIQRGKYLFYTSKMGKKYTFYKLNDLLNFYPDEIDIKESIVIPLSDRRLLL